MIVGITNIMENSIHGNIEYNGGNGCVGIGYRGNSLTE